MTIRMWLRSKKYNAKVWVKNHKAHIIATISTIALAGLLVWMGSNALAEFIDKEFIAPTIANEIPDYEKLN